MSDPRADKRLTLGDRTYMVRFTHGALAEAERLMGMKVPDIMMLVGAGRFGFGDLTCLVTAGLEGARRKLRLGGDPWTVDRVEDLLDDADNFEAAADPVIDAFAEAMRKWFPDLYTDAQDSLGGDAEDPPAAAGTGTTSAEPPSEPASASTTSGA